MLNLFQAIINRGNTRDFEKLPVDDNKIGLLLYTASQAPSAGNTQEWEFVVVKDEEQKKKLAIAALHQEFVAKAPVVIVVCANLERVSLKYKERGEFLYSIQDTAYASLLISLAAHALGLGSYIVVAFDEEHVKDILELPKHIRPFSIIPIGYSKEKAEIPTKVPFENLTSVDKYGKKYEFAMAWEASHEKEEHRAIQPLSIYVEDLVKKLTKEKKIEKKERKLTFENFLKKLIR